MALLRERDKVSEYEIRMHLKEKFLPFESTPRLEQSVDDYAVSALCKYVKAGVLVYDGKFSMLTDFTRTLERCVKTLAPFNLEESLRSMQ